MLDDSGKACSATDWIISIGPARGEFVRQCPTAHSGSGPAATRPAYRAGVASRTAPPAGPCAVADGCHLDRGAVADVSAMELEAEICREMSSAAPTSRRASTSGAICVAEHTEARWLRAAAEVDYEED